MEVMVILGAVFFIISGVVSSIGIGGGILYVPILLFAGISIKRAPAISLILIMATSSAALFTFWKNRKVDWKLALVIDPPTDIMAFVGGYFSAALSEKFLEGLLVGVLMVAGTLMLRKNTNHSSGQITINKWWYWDRNFSGTHYRVNLPLVLAATASIGVLSGMLGITGGIIKLPIMVLLCGVPMDIAVGTSTIMVAVTAFSGLAGHVLNGQVDWQSGLLLAVAAILGGSLGSRISLKTDKFVLKQIFGIAVLLVAIQLSLKLIF
jgi:uncharacterized membrane protein YfcA